MLTHVNLAYVRNVWHSTNDIASPFDAFTIDLGCVAVIRKVKFRNAANHVYQDRSTKGMILYVSRDDSTYTEMLTLTDIPSVIGLSCNEIYLDVFEVDNGMAVGRYVKVHITDYYRLSAAIQHLSFVTDTCLCTA